MGVQSGVSSVGQQTVNLSAGTGLTALSIGITSQRLPPIRRVGYFYLYQYQLALPNQCYVVDDGLMRAPGEWLKISVPLFSSAWGYRCDVIWTVNGLAWTATIN